MTEAVAPPAVIDLKPLLEGEFSLAAYSQIRRAAQSNEVNAKQLEELILDLDETKPDEAMKRGVCCMILGRTAQAMELLREAHPKHELASIFLGKCLLDMDRVDEALDAYRTALKSHSDSVPIAIGLVFAELRAGDHEAGLKSLDSAEERFGSNVETVFLRGFYDELCGEYAPARVAYEKVIEQVPQHPHALFRLARWHQTWGEEEVSIELYEKIRGARPTYANALLNLGSLYEDYQRYEQAIECYREVLASIPNHSRAVMFLQDARSSKTMFYDEEGERRADRQSAILKIPVTDFELSVRSRNCLNKMNIKTLGDLIQMSEQDLLAHKNFGETSLMEVKQMLAQKGLRLGQGKMDGGFRSAAAAAAPAASEEDEDQPIESLNLSVRSAKCMERLGLLTIGQLLSRTEAELLSAKNFGLTSLNEIKARLEERNLRLKDSSY
ncbi:MAG: tetratricopeptide repeat protein [Planctomycetes bacterium]|nr:tetratricopeptide repeat protein [Planctomycetota bacterium]